MNKNVFLHQLSCQLNWNYNAIDATDFLKQYQNKIDMLMLDKELSESEAITEIGTVHDCILACKKEKLSSTMQQMYKVMSLGVCVLLIYILYSQPLLLQQIPYLVYMINLVGPLVLIILLNSRIFDNCIAMPKTLQLILVVMGILNIVVAIIGYQQQAFSSLGIIMICLDSSLLIGLLWLNYTYFYEIIPWLYVIMGSLMLHLQWRSICGSTDPGLAISLFLPFICNLLISLLLMYWIERKNKTNIKKRKLN